MLVFLSSCFFVFLDCHQNAEAITRKLSKPALTLTLLLHFLTHQIYSKVSIIGAYLFSLDFSGNFHEIKSLFKGDPAKMTHRGRIVKWGIDEQILAQSSYLFQNMKVLIVGWNLGGDHTKQTDSFWMSLSARKCFDCTCSWDPKISVWR